LNTLEPEVLNQFDSLDIQTTNVTEVMDGISKLMIGLYSTTEDFFVLHGVTSCHSMKLILGLLHLEDQPQVIRCYLRALMATYIMQNQPPIESVNFKEFSKQLSNISWEKLLQSAISNEDEHVIKLVWTCWKEKNDGYDLYLYSATRKLELLTNEPKELLWPWAVGAIAVVLTTFFNFKEDQNII